MRGDLESGGSWASVPQPQARQTTANGQGPPPGQVRASRRAGGLQAGRWRPGTGRGWAAPVLTAALRGCYPRGSRPAVCSPGQTISSLYTALVACFWPLVAQVPQCPPRAGCGQQHGQWALSAGSVPTESPPMDTRGARPQPLPAASPAPRAQGACRLICSLRLKLVPLPEQSDPPGPLPGGLCRPSQTRSQCPGQRECARQKTPPRGANATDGTRVGSSPAPPSAGPALSPMQGQLECEVSGWCDPHLSLAVCFSTKVGKVPPSRWGQALVGPQDK